MLEEGDSVACPEVCYYLWLWTQFLVVCDPHVTKFTGDPFVLHDGCYSVNPVRKRCTESVSSHSGEWCVSILFCVEFHVAPMWGIVGEELLEPKGDYKYVRSDHDGGYAVEGEGKMTNRKRMGAGKSGTNKCVFQEIVRKKEYSVGCISSTSSVSRVS